MWKQMVSNLEKQKYLFQHLKHFTRAAVCLQSIEEPSVKDGIVKQSKPLWFYDNKGIRQRKLKRLLKRIYNEDQAFKTYDDQYSSAQRTVAVFSKYGFTRAEIEILLYQKPRLLELSKAALTKRFQSFNLLQLPKVVVHLMVVKCPALLLLDLEFSLQNRLNMLQALPLIPQLTQERCIFLIQKCPTLLLSCTEEATLKKKVHSLVKLGFNHQQIYQLIMKLPAVLTYKSESITRKVKFVTEEMGVGLPIFVKFPRILSSSERRLRERYAYLGDEGFLTKGSYISENKIRSIVLTTDNDFVYRVTNTKMKDYRNYQTRFWDERSTDDGQKDILDEDSLVNTREDEGKRGKGLSE